MTVLELDKPKGVRCTHLSDIVTTKSCLVYGTKTRPPSCEQWACIWRSGSNLIDADARPDRVGVMLARLESQDPAVEIPAVICVYEVREGASDEPAARALLTKVEKQYATLYMNGPHRGSLTGPSTELDLVVAAIDVRAVLGETPPKIRDAQDTKGAA